MAAGPSDPQRPADMRRVTRTMYANSVARCMANLTAATAHARAGVDRATRELRRMDEDHRRRGEADIIRSVLHELATGHAQAMADINGAITAFAEAQAVLLTLTALKAAGETPE